MTKTVRIGSGLGFYGDSWDPVVATIERGGGSYPLAARVKYKEPSAYTTRSALGVEEQRVPVVLDIVDDPSRWTELGA